MSRRYRLGLVAAFVVQVALLGWMIVDRALILQSGREVRLTAQPVDPRDIFRGDYVALTYNLSHLSSLDLNGPGDFEMDEPIYVRLTEGVDGWSPAGFSHTPPPDGVFVRGIVQLVNRGGACKGRPGCAIYDVDYNIEKFFVPEGTGRALRSDQKLAVDVAIGRDGRAELKRLLVDGTPRYETLLW